MKVAIALLALVALAAAVPQQWTFEGNVTDQTADYKFRFSGLFSTLNIVTWISASVEAHGSASGATGGNIDTLIGFVFAGTGGLMKTYPYSWMIYAKVAFSGTPSSADIKAAAGGIGTVYEALVEKNPNGQIVRNVELGAAWSVSAVTTAGELSVVTMTLTDGSLTVELSFIASNVVGQISYGDAIVTPRSLQCVIEITGYPYANPLNHLELFIGVATVNAKFSGNAMISQQSGSDVYFTLADTAYINGTIHDVTVTKYVDRTFANAGVVATLKGVLQADLQTRQTSIVFGPGATKIIYDPSYGNGKVPYGASGAIVPSILLVAFLALLLL